MSCGTGSSCVPLSKRCDGRLDCSSGLDESNCPGPCASDQFQCVQQGKCIPITWRCDGQVDCEGDEDELACGNRNLYKGLLYFKHKKYCVNDIYQVFKIDTIVKIICFCDLRYLK